MFDIGWSELLVIGALALIVVGPKELPGMLRTFGQVVGKARGMAREFQRSMEDAAREVDVSELRDVQKSMSDWNRKIGAGAPKAYAEDALKKAMADTGPKPVPAVVEPKPATADASAPTLTPVAPTPGATAPNPAAVAPSNLAGAPRAPEAPASDRG